MRLIYYFIAFFIYFLPFATQAKREYLHTDANTCQNLPLRCEMGTYPFFDPQGCGCQTIENIDLYCITTVNQHFHTDTEAGIRFSIFSPLSDSNLLVQPDEIESLNQKKQRVGFKWSRLSTQKALTDFLPSQGIILESAPLTLINTNGMLYVVKVTTENNQYFEVHAIIPRYAADISYNFYITAETQEALKPLLALQQAVLNSIEWLPVKHYIPDLTVENCKNKGILCPPLQEIFRDEQGCGCVTLEIKKP